MLRAALSAFTCRHVQRTTYIGSYILVLAQQTSSLSALRADFRFSRRETDLLEEELLANVFLAAAASKSDAVPRSVQVFKRNKQWFESTLPNLPAYFFKQSFRVMPSAFWYLVDLCRPHM